MWISEALAQDATAPATAAPTPSLFDTPLVPMVAMVVVFYFLLIRPQQKRMKEHQQMLGGLKRGDKVVTGGGIIGTVDKIEDHEVTIEIAAGVKVKAMRDTISTVVARTGERTPGDKPKGKEAKVAGANDN